MQVAAPAADLHDKLALLGWTVSKITFKNGAYVAKATSDTGQSIERVGKSPENALAAVYQFAARSSQIRRLAALKKLGAWSTNWLDQTHDIGHAYAKLPTFDEKAVPAWKALAAESKVQADAIRKQINVEETDDPDPYPNMEAMQHDIHHNKHLLVSRSNAEHPIWTQEDAVNFRIVQDVLGHAQSGGGYDWHGKNLAAAYHMPLVSPEAREALFTETIGRPAYEQTHHGYAPKKVGLMSEFLHPAQAKEGEHVWVPHGGLPDLTSVTPGPNSLTQQPGQWVNPVAFPSTVMAPMPGGVMNGFNFQSAKTVSIGNPQDPNANWVPPTRAEPVTPENDYIGLADTIDNAAKIDTQWWDKDPATQKLAVMNAFRVALLSPRKHLKWNSAHAQAIMHADPATKARDLWDILENAREEHNQKLGYPEGSHLAYKKNLDYLAHKLVEEHPGLDLGDAYRMAKEIAYTMIKKFENTIEELSGGKGDEASELRKYNQARRMLTEWMRQTYAVPKGWQPAPEGQLTLAAVEDLDNEREQNKARLLLEYSQTVPEHKLGWEEWLKQKAAESRTKVADTLFNPEETGSWAPIDMSGFSQESSKYGAFMGGHLDAIEQVGKHIDEIRQAALYDLEHEGGRGFYFRNAVMNMNLKGVNPKVASFAWLLLNPLGSELGIIDTHIARGLGVHGDEVTPRDYYKLERQQRAAKDATGYPHLPLGLYHWGLWDLIRNPGEHSDHSALRVLDPLPWNSPEAKWDASTTGKAGPWVGPPQFEVARGPMAQAALDFDNQFAGSPAGKVPNTRLFDG